MGTSLRTSSAHLKELQPPGGSDWCRVWQTKARLADRLLPATDPADQQRVVDSELDHRVQILVSLVQQIVQLKGDKISMIKNISWMFERFNYKNVFLLPSEKYNFSNST